MASVGLLYVGAILFLNGMMLLGFVEGRSAAPLNIFVGLLQVVTPTFLIFTAGGDANVVLNASGLYLFGFTYLYVAFNQLLRLDGSGLGYFSLFVAVCAVVYSAINFVQFGDGAFGVIWLYWAFLWALFFVLLGLGRESWTRYTGAVCAIQGWVTGFLPAFLLLTGAWDQWSGFLAPALAVFGLAVFGALYVSLKPAVPAASPPAAPAAPAAGA